MKTDSEVPETRVLAIASHVTYGYVGNTIASFVMQSLGCEVSAINTVAYSNHTGYKQVKGRKTTAEEIQELYDGLKQSYLTDFDVLLSGYIPSAAAVEAVGKIGRDLKYNAGTKPGSFFWVLDPVMGDEGRLYIPEDEVPIYKQLLRSADLILPNQFEAELLSETTITDLASLGTAIHKLHRTYHTPHIIITSLRLSPENKPLPSRPVSPSPDAKVTEPAEILTIIGSTATSDHSPRLWRIDIPAFPIFFSGTGDMFAALTVARLREAVHEAGIGDRASWLSPDDVEPEDLPLARAAEKVLASMQAILGKTASAWQKEVEVLNQREDLAGREAGEDGDKERSKEMHLRRTKAAEVRVVRNVRDLIEPQDIDKFRARAVQEVMRDADDEAGIPTPDELGVNKVGGDGEGAVQLEGPQDSAE